MNFIFCDEKVREDDEMGDELKSAQQLKLKIYNLVCVHTFVYMYIREIYGREMDWRANICIIHT